MPTTSTFKPAWWLNNPHLQTIYPAFCRNLSPVPELQRERLTTPDNDFIDIDWCGTGDKPLVILLHGLAGSSRSPYIRGLQIAFWQMGWRSVAMNYRGCSGEYNRTWRCYHSGETSDIDFLYRELRQREPNTPMAAVGFSLGGNMLLKWLGEQSHAIKLFAAVAVSVPFLLNLCATKLDSGFSQLYNQYLLHNLKQYVHAKRAHLHRLKHFDDAQKLADLGNLKGIHSFWQYDHQVIAKLYGFKDAQDYYQRNSSRQFLKTIQVPTLIIQAIDDPFMTTAVLPEPHELSDAVTLEATSAGGHVGFIGGENPLKPTYWLDKRIPGYLGRFHGLALK